jgi:hypothetical protein
LSKSELRKQKSEWIFSNSIIGFKSDEEKILEINYPATVSVNEGYGYFSPSSDFGKIGLLVESRGIEV